MRTGLVLLLAGALFALLATANSGGYRYGASDQAFYQPAIAIAANPALFPRDRVVLTPQTRFMLGDDVLGWIARHTGDDLPTLFASVYAITLAALFAAAITLGRRLGCDWWTIAAFLILLTFRHRIAKTGANSLEGYMHLRMLAFAIGIAALGSLARNRFGAAAVWTAIAAVVHTTTAVWFGATIVFAVGWRMRDRRGLIPIAVGAVILACAAILFGPLSGHLTTMDPAWLAVLADKDYLFPAHWPLYAWVVNLAYPVVLVLIYRRRRTLACVAPGEDALVAGLLALVAVFFVSVPLTEWHIALAVQAQVTRVFWLLDVVVALYVGWWMAADLTARWSVRARLAVGTVLVAASAARGGYMLRADAHRSLVELRLPVNAWTDAMAWLGTQPISWHVLADPAHAWKYGVSVRVAAARDTLLESSKDAALAMYDRPLALRVAERSRALAAFDTFTDADVRALDATYALDVFVDRADRRFTLPVLYRNDQFVIYDLR